MNNAYADLPMERLKALRADLENMRTSHLREGQRLLDQLQRVKRAMETAPREPMIVSDHALVRWLERVEGYDVEALRAKMSDAVRAADPVGDAYAIQTHGIQLCVDAGRIVTVLPLEGRFRTRREPPL